MKKTAVSEVMNSNLPLDEKYEIIATLSSHKSAMELHNIYIRSCIIDTLRKCNKSMRVWEMQENHPYLNELANQKICAEVHKLVKSGIINRIETLTDNIVAKHRDGSPIYEKIILFSLVEVQ